MSTGAKIVAYKKVGETPLECLERVRIESGISVDVPMTYAGRLDPMAEGMMMILIGDACKDKEKYLGLDKEYEVEIVFGANTDTYDALGMATYSKPLQLTIVGMEVGLKRYVGKFSQQYPPYSSKTVFARSDLRKEQLHSLARKGQLPEEMPTKEVEIYSIDLLENGFISAEELKDRILNNIALVKGDFRQSGIVEKWNDLFKRVGSFKFPTAKIRVKCSSGTYMRSLAERIGKDMKIGAFALTIKRIRIL
jgi:tRNA pseudouridine55 synthase